MKEVKCLNWVVREKNSKYGWDFTRYFKTMDQAIKRASELEIDMNTYCDVFEVRSDGSVIFYNEWRELV